MKESARKARLQPISCKPVHCIGSPSAAMKSCRVHNHLRVLQAARRARMRDTAARAESRARVPLFCVTVIVFCISFCIVGAACAAPWLIFYSRTSFFLLRSKNAICLLTRASSMASVRSSQIITAS